MSDHAMTSHEARESGQPTTRPEDSASKSSPAATTGETPATVGGTAVDEARERRILVGVDTSEDGLRAARFAARAAVSMGARVELVHVLDDAVLAGAWGVIYDPGLLQESAEEGMAVARQAVLEAGLPEDRVSTTVTLGNAAAVLSRMSDDAGLLVVGRRSVSGLERMFVGSTSVAVAAMAHCPVLVVSAASNPDTTTTRGLVVVGLDAGPHAAHTLRAACAEAQRRGARLEVVHSCEPSGGGLFGFGHSHEKAREAELEAARAGVAELVDTVRADFPGLDLSVQVQPGNPVDALVARTGHADLLVLGIVTNHTTHQLGGVIRGLMAHSQAPVLLVP